MNDSLENILSNYEREDREYKIKEKCLESFLDYYATELENLKYCEKCNSTGFIVFSEEDKYRLNKRLSKLDEAGAFTPLMKNKIKESTEIKKECGCKGEIKRLRKADKIMRALIMKERLNMNLCWNLEIEKFENMTDFRTHYILSLLAEYRTPLNEYQKCTSFWIHDYLLTKEKVLEMRNYNFAYLICTGISIPNREWLIANLMHKCDKLFTYKIKSKKDRTL